MLPYLPGLQPAEELRNGIDPKRLRAEDLPPMETRGKGTALGPGAWPGRRVSARRSPPLRK